VNDTNHKSPAKRRLVSATRRVAVDPSLRAGLFVFGLTRLLILFVILLSSGIVFEPTVSTPFGVVHESSISLHRQSVAETLRRVTMGADSAWLMNIAINGYEKEPFNTATQHTWAYFPLYPLIWRWAAKLSGDFPLTGMALSNFFLLAALILLHRTVGAFGYEQGVADRTIFYIAAFPTSYFFSLAQTESLFLLLTVSCLYAAKRERWWLAGIVGALASATRFAGVFLLIPLGVLYWQANRTAAVDTSPDSKRVPGKIKANIVALLLVPVGLFVYMLYLKSVTGDAFAFAHIQVAWGHSAGFFWRPILTYLRDPLLLSVRWDFRLPNFAAAVMALVCAAVLLKRGEWALGLFAAVSILVPMSTQPLLQSLARYVMVIFPIFVVLAVAGRAPRVDQTIRAIFIGLLCLMSALLVARVTLTFS
jgi:Gpi18-like mannosyltransferase